MNLKKNIIEKAILLGFPVIKFAKEQTLNDEIKHLNNWLALGYNARMNYMEQNIDKKKSVKLLLKNTKTIIVFAYPFPANVDFKGKLKIAKHSTQPDYHVVIKEKLSIISKYLFNDFGINNKYFVDTAPILEKQWAVKSGLGWQGKNSMIINPVLGSYFNIGIMLVDIELETDIELDERCGKCKRCIIACPTSAIVSDKIIDCRKCIVKFAREDINNLSFEEKKTIKETGYIWGCDICQDVCPYNKKRQAEDPIVFSLLNEIENMNEEEFNNIFQHSPLFRKGYQRILEDIALIKM